MIRGPGASNADDLFRLCALRRALRTPETSFAFQRIRGSGGAGFPPRRLPAQTAESYLNPEPLTTNDEWAKPKRKAFNKNHLQHSPQALPNSIRRHAGDAGKPTESRWNRSVSVCEGRPPRPRSPRQRLSTQKSSWRLQRPTPALSRARTSRRSRRMRRSP